MDKPTSEKTDAELALAYEAYVLSKTVDGRYCPTPDLVSDTDPESEPPSCDGERCRRC